MLSKCCSLYKGQSFCERVIKLSFFLMRQILSFSKQLLTCIVFFSFLLLSSTHTFSNCNYHGLSLPNVPDVSLVFTLTVFHSSLTLNDKQLAVWQGEREKTALHYALIVQILKGICSFLTDGVSVITARYKNLIASFSNVVPALIMSVSCT